MFRNIEKCVPATVNKSSTEKNVIEMLVRHTFIHCARALTPPVTSSRDEPAMQSPFPRENFVAVHEHRSTSEGPTVYVCLYVCLPMYVCMYVSVYVCVLYAGKDRIPGVICVRTSVSTKVKINITQVSKHQTPSLQGQIIGAGFQSRNTC